IGIFPALLIRADHAQIVVGDGAAPVLTRALERRERPAVVDQRVAMVAVGIREDTEILLDAAAKDRVVTGEGGRLQGSGAGLRPWPRPRRQSPPARSMLRRRARRRQSPWQGRNSVARAPWLPRARHDDGAGSIPGASLRTGSGDRPDARRTRSPTDILQPP